MSLLLEINQMDLELLFLNESQDLLLSSASR
jgi:hypothetical protein